MKIELYQGPHDGAQLDVPAEVPRKLDVDGTMYVISHLRGRDKRWVFTYQPKKSDEEAKEEDEAGLASKPTEEPPRDP